MTDTHNQKIAIKQLSIPDELVGQRVDKALTQLLGSYSRSTVQSWIRDGMVLIDDEAPKPKDKVLGGEEVEITIVEEQSGEWPAQAINFSVVYDDDDVIVISKPAGLVVHPGAGNLDQTLLNGILHRYPDNRALPRAGIVHRLDKDTSGLMLVARNEMARLSLIAQLSDHSLHREYCALVAGRVISGGVIDEPLARDKYDRRKMAVNSLGKEAVTHYRVAERFRNHTLLSVQLETGRTHQIRVHMAFQGFPLVGDPVYGRRLAIPKNCSDELEVNLRQFRRQALHAVQIRYRHPRTDEECAHQVGTEEDLQHLINACRIDAEQM